MIHATLRRVWNGVRWLVFALWSILEAIRVLYHAKYEKIPLVESGKRLIVCGNGPSLQNQLQDNMAVFQGHDVLCVNQFASTQWFGMVRPRYYCIMDPVCASDPQILTEDMRKKLDDAWAALERVDWKMELLLPRDLKKSRYLQDRVRRLSVPIRYLNMHTFSGWKFLQTYFLKKQLCSPGAQTVLIAALYYGICKGYEKIILLGAETNWVKGLNVDETNQPYFREEHCYGTAEKRMLVDGWGRTISVAEELECEARVFRQYMFLDRYARSQDCVIYNATPDSLVDAFARTALTRWTEDVQKCDNIS